MSVASASLGPVSQKKKKKDITHPFPDMKCVKSSLFVSPRTISTGKTVHWAGKTLIFIEGYHKQCNQGNV